MSKYESGYWPKIKYWTAQLNEAVASGDLRGVDSAHRKLDYFINREWETNGVPKESNVIAGVDFSESLSQLAGLSIK
jgi:hypothetical protein